MKKNHKNRVSFKDLKSETNRLGLSKSWLVTESDKPNPRSFAFKSGKHWSDKYAR